MQINCIFKHCFALFLISKMLCWCNADHPITRYPHMECLETHTLHAWPTSFPQVLSPLSKGLFHRAVLQSGSATVAGYSTNTPAVFAQVRFLCLTPKLLWPFWLCNILSVETSTLFVKFSKLFLQSSTYWLFVFTQKKISPGSISGNQSYWLGQSHKQFQLILRSYLSF